MCPFKYGYGANMTIYISSYSFVNVKAPVADELEGKGVVAHVAMSSLIVLKSVPVAQRRLLARTKVQDIPQMIKTLGRMLLSAIKLHYARPSNKLR